MKKAILFDIDGTLLNSWDFIIDAMEYSLMQHGYPKPSKKQLNKAMGKPLIEFYQMLIPTADYSRLASTHHEFQKTKHYLIKPFPNTIKTLDSLKNSGFSLAAISNRMRESLLESLKTTGIFDYFDVIVSADDVESPKPHPDPLLMALKKLKVESNNSYMVGDTEQDVLAGQAAQVKTVGVTYGLLGHRIKKHRPDYVINDIGELLGILK